VEREFVSKGKQRMQMQVVHGSRIVPKAEHQALLMAVSERRRAKFEREQQMRALARRPKSGEDSTEMKIAIRSVELRIVRGLFVLEISLPPEGVPSARQHGLEYMVEREDHYLAGRWLHTAPRPAVPSPKEISAAEAAVRWIDALPEEEDRRFLRAAAQSKKGERGRGVAWERVISRLPHLAQTSPRTLQERYQRCLRLIVADHMLRQMEK
jgi:hypothetical protein